MAHHHTPPSLWEVEGAEGGELDGGYVLLRTSPSVLVSVGGGRGSGGGR